MDTISQLDDLVSDQSAAWPAWATRLFVFLILLVVTVGFAKLRKSLTETAELHDMASSPKAAAFSRFQKQYLVVHFVISLADWMQGTNMYTLYQSYGVDVGALYLTGFTSSALFSVVAGLYADKQVRDYGRIVYCIIEIVVNALEHVPNFYTLFLSRILGGMSTSLLCSVFESRMVSAHRQRGFPEEWLSQTFGLASASSGFAAILAGVLAQIACDWRGDIGPFQAAIALTCLALVLILLLNSGPSWSVGTESESNEVASSCKGVDCLRSEPQVLLLGLSTSLFEGVVYTVVFCWVPTVQAALGADHLPSGLVFSCFMLCLTLGGFAFPEAIKVASAECCAYCTFGVSAVALLTLSMCSSLPMVMGCLLVFEFCIGMFYPCAAMLRSQYIPDDTQESLMNILRFPLNILVVIGTWLAGARPPHVVFSVCAAWLLLAALLQFILGRYQTQKKGAKKCH